MRGKKEPPAVSTTERCLLSLEISLLSAIAPALTAVNIVLYYGAYKKRWLPIVKVWMTYTTGQFNITSISFRFVLQFNDD